VREVGDVPQPPAARRERVAQNELQVMLSRWAFPLPFPARYHEVQPPPSRPLLQEMLMSRGSPPPLRTAATLPAATDSGRRLTPPPSTSSQLRPRRRRRCRDAIGTPRGIASRRSPLRGGVGRRRGCGSGRVGTCCHRWLTRCVRVAARREACGLPCGDAAMDGGGSGDRGM